MSENQLLTLIVVVVVAILVVVLLRAPSGGSPATGPSLRVILLGAAVVLFVLTGLGVLPGTTWGLACLAAAFLF